MAGNGGSVQRSQSYGSLGSTDVVQNWQTYQYPYPYVYWTPPAPDDDYANDIEVTEGEHDVTLRFFRKAASSRSLVKTLTIPRSLWDGLTKRKK